MKWFIYTNLVDGDGFKMRSCHASLDDAMREVHAKWHRPHGRHNFGWWWSPQMDKTGAIEFLSFNVPDRDMTEAEMENWYRANNLKRTPGLVARTTDWSKVTHCDMPSGRVSCIHVVREDRVGDNLKRIGSAGNDVSEELETFTSLMAN